MEVGVVKVVGVGDVVKGLFARRPPGRALVWCNLDTPEPEPHWQPEARADLGLAGCQCQRPAKWCDCL